VPHNGRGFVKRGLQAVLTEAFGIHGLHRLEANIQPDNEASRHLVRGLGFRFEGFSPRYLKVAGRWRDHERWALTAEEWHQLGLSLRSTAPASRSMSVRSLYT
jgi:ribosomal-protein-alanine N-acetyltransferase